MRQLKQRFSRAGCLARTAAFGLASGLAIFASTQAPATSSPYTGEIQMFAGNFCPKGWAPADGRLLSVAGNEALFTLYYNHYGGDGRTTFGIPDLRGRVPRGAGDAGHSGTLYLGNKTSGGIAEADPNYNGVNAGSVNAVGVVNFCIYLDWGVFPTRP
ncbi:MAG: phage tail protein [Hyphomicrobiales bacterium]|nr:tail fiber protein [Hyphomicrobiales bacterium]PCJ90516.1 MAG: phage tail protein [Hyphomicrobiales bacterium]